jgi:tetratricopeptide (TPR) repeat protein
MEHGYSDSYLPKRIFMKTLFQFLFFTISTLINQVTWALTLEDSINHVEQIWGETYYSSEDNVKAYKGKNEKQAIYEELILETEALAKTYPKKSEPLVWRAILYANIAGTMGLFQKLNALEKVKQAKQIFEDSLNLDPNALFGTAYINLGILYHEVPGSPLGFGDLKKSKEMFEKALSIYPNSIDVNFNYGKLLEDEGQKAKAIELYKKALKINVRPKQSFVDQKLKEEVLTRLKALEPTQVSEYMQILKNPSETSTEQLPVNSTR